MATSVGPDHVPTYHEWMKDPDLLEATGSEPLSFDEEVKMQQSWKEDESKCTFIVHATEACKLPSKKIEKTQQNEEDGESGFEVDSNLEAMIGDVNLFLSDIEESHESDVEISAQAIDSSLQAEVDIMIARKEFRAKGLGRAATCTMLLYGATKLGIKRFFCKINEDNTDSIRMFKAIGFEECNYAACFKQVELELQKSLHEMVEIFERYGNFSIIPCCAEQ